ncbi:uncharacterized protein [Narcine bancroftii]|uniref:uncharacterized protein n=1 Tax=Narcine bancroftii TaxID=1343680 RepID=UPI0038313D88
MEAQFYLCQISSDTTKFYHVVAALDLTTARRVLHIIQHSPAEDKYKTIKRVLTGSIGLSRHQCATRMLHLDALGKRSPKELMDKMLMLMGDHTNCPLFECIFLDHMPRDFQPLLVQESFINARKIAQEAQDLWLAQFPEGSAVQQIMSHVHNHAKPAPSAPPTPAPEHCSVVGSSSSVFRVTSPAIGAPSSHLHSGHSSPTGWGYSYTAPRPTTRRPMDWSNDCTATLSQHSWPASPVLNGWTNCLGCSWASTPLPRKICRCHQLSWSTVRRWHYLVNSSTHLTIPSGCRTNYFLTSGHTWICSNPPPLPRHGTRPLMFPANCFPRCMFSFGGARPRHLRSDRMRGRTGLYSVPALRSRWTLAASRSCLLWTG